MTSSRPTLHIAFALCACLASAFAAADARADEVLVFAASSLKPALDSIIELPEAQEIGAIKASYAASSQLARQIEHGAPAALFISADPDWMDHVEQRGLVIAGTRSDLLGNALVLIAPRDSSIKLSISAGFDLAGALGDDGRLAIAEPNSVPAGKYAKAALSTLGTWTQVESRIVAAVNVRVALGFVAQNELPLGIVYRSDATSNDEVRVIDTFPSWTHAPIVYPVALLKDNDSAAARRFLDLLHSANARTIFVRNGFDALPQ